MTTETRKIDIELRNIAVTLGKLDIESKEGNMRFGLQARKLAIQARDLMTDRVLVLDPETYRKNKL